MNTTTKPNWPACELTIYVDPDLRNAAEFRWTARGDVTVALSAVAVYPGNLPYVLRQIADELERHLTPDCAGYLPPRRLRLVPALTSLIPAHREGER